jgi:hypothetical protein
MQSAQEVLLEQLVLDQQPVAQAVRLLLLVQHLQSVELVVAQIQLLELRAQPKVWRIMVQQVRQVTHQTSQVQLVEQAKSRLNTGCKNG